MPKPHSQSSRRIVETCLGEVWAIDPFKLEQICGFLELRANGYTPSEDEIRLSMAEGRSADEPPEQDT